MELRIKCFCKDLNVNFNLDVFIVGMFSRNLCIFFSDSCCFNVGELQLAKWAKSSFFTIVLKKDKNAEEITVTKVVTSATKKITNTELRFAVNEIDKLHDRPKKYQREIPEKVKREVGNHALTFEILSAIKKFSVKYPKFTFIRTSVNNSKNKLRPEVIILSLKK